MFRASAWLVIEIVRRVNHRLALSKLLAERSFQKTELGAAHPLRGKTGSVLGCALKGAADTILVACNPPKKHGPWVVACLAGRVVTPSGDPV